MNAYVIGYDVRDRKRLIRVHRRMTHYAVPIEYSIFVFYGTDHACQVCLDDVLRLMDLRVDDFRCYRLPFSGQEHRIGRPALPEGIVWTGLPPPLWFVEPSEESRKEDAS